MAEKREYLYSLVRYLPDLVRSEFVHIGAIIREPSNVCMPKTIFTTEWNWLRVAFPEADIDLLEAICMELAARLSEGSASEAALLLETMTTTWSNSLQITESKSILADSLDSGLERLGHHFVLSPTSQPHLALVARS